MTSSAFKLVTRQKIASLNVTVEHYRHTVTGAEHYHLAADDPQNVFMVALRTVPMDSAGVAHILEHTTLCGSEKFPVRDPFFMMIRRSLNTFMNAFTSSDWTAYPFATENKKDFNNLLQVYMDAVFFPNLNELDFIQEGHRVEFEEKENKASDLVYKGVVFNEMKGAMSSEVSVLWQAFSSELYPASTYHYNSGGEPEDIPNLTYQQLVEFHQYHYHPSNAVFMTYGDISAQTHQASFEKLALSRFDDQVDVVKVSSEERYTEPKSVKGVYASDDEETANKTHIVMGWLLGENKDTMDILRGHLLSSILLDNSASPLRKVLEQTDLAEAPSPLCGMEDSNKEMAFMVGVQGSEESHTGAIETLILDELTRVATQGVDADEIESALHQLELSQREIGGDGYPYGLQLMLQSLAGAMHDGDPISLLDTDKALKALRIEALADGFIQNLVKTWLLDNVHRVSFTMSPDLTLSAQKEAAEKAKLASIKASLSDEQADAIIKQSLDLDVRQSEEDDMSLLPEVTKEDVPALRQPLPATCIENNGISVTGYKAGTNGIVYQQMIIELPDLTQEEQCLMPLFNACLPEVGSAGRDYLETQLLQSAVSGGVGAKTSIRSHLYDNEKHTSHFIMSSKGLNSHQQSLSDLLNETLFNAKFTELDRLKDLMGQVRVSIDQRVTGNGHAMAMQAASQHFSPLANWSFKRTGFAGIQFIKDLHEKVTASDDALAEFSKNLASIHQKLVNSPKQMLLVADAEGLDEGMSIINASHAVTDATSNNALASFTPLTLTATHKAVKQAWMTSTQVNFCAKAYPAVATGHEDAPKLAVLSACLRNGYLHSAVREKGGAYGGGAAYNAEIGSFQFYSYRDPRLMETYADFDKALDWLLSDDAQQNKVDEAILNVVSSLDKPGSPSGDARKGFYLKLYGRDFDARMAYRDGVLSATLDELRVVAKRYIVQENASYAVLSHEGMTDTLVEEGFEIFTL